MFKIIIVDDEKHVINSICKYISNFLPQFEIVGCFSDGEEALAFLQCNSVDIVITDIRMPNMDGLELVRRIRKGNFQATIIIISGYSDFEYAHTAIKYQVSNYLLKPIDFKELKKALITVVANVQPNDSSLLGSALSSKNTELFFLNLRSGHISTVAELEHKFSQLNLPILLSQTNGYLIKLSSNQIRDENANQITRSAKNIIQFLLSSPIYFSQRQNNDIYYVILGDIEITESMIKSIVECISVTIHFDCSVSVLQHFDSLYDFIERNEVTNESSKGSNQLFNDRMIEKAIKYLDENYSKELNREDVANMVYLSPSHFSFIFKQKTGMSFVDYLTKLRIQKAIELLHTKMKISDIAKYVGYTSPNRFFINFRRYTSYTPSEYRRKLICQEIDNDENQI